MSARGPGCRGPEARLQLWLLGAVPRAHQGRLQKPGATGNIRSEVAGAGIWPGGVQ